MTKPPPSSYQQIEEIVGLVQTFHAACADACCAAANALGENNRGLTIQALAARQRELAEFVATTRQAMEEKVAETWLQFVPYEPIEASLAAMRNEDGGDEDIVSLILEFQNGVVDFLQILWEESESADVQESLQSLIEREQLETKYSAKTIVEEM